MTRVLTFADVLWLLLTLGGQLMTMMARSRHNVMAIVVTLCLLMLALSVFLSYRCVRISLLRNPYLLDELPEQSLHLYDQMASVQHQNVLLRHRPPLTLHYMWCRNGHLEFKHYLSLLSVAKVLKPDQIVFHYLQMPEKDRKGYFTWFEDIQREVAMISLRPLQDARHCGHHFSKGLPKNEDFPSNDGVFMMEDVAISNLSREAFYQRTGADKLLTYSCQQKSQGSCEGVGRLPAQLFLVPTSEPYHLGSGEGRSVIECPTIETFNAANTSACVQLSQRLFPSDIWLRNKSFDRFARWLAYAHPEPIRSQPDPERSAPNVAHILTSDTGDLSPLCYASIVSAFTRGEMTHVFVHGLLDSGGANSPVWKQLAGKFPLTHIPTPSLEGVSDPRRWLRYGLQVLLQYGGLLLSCDTVVQKPLQPLLQFAAVSTVQKSIYRIVHHHMDLSVLLASPASRYLQTLIPVLQQLPDVTSGGDVGAVAYHLYEHHPATLSLRSDLVAHLTCKGDRCVPSPGQLDVRQAYTVKLTWAEGSSAAPSTWQQWTQLSTPLTWLSSLPLPS